MLKKTNFKKIVFKKHPKKDDLTRKSKKKAGIKYSGLKDIRNLFDQNDDDKVYEDIKCLFNEYEEIKKDVYEPIKISVAFNDNYVEYKSESERDKSISIKKYPDRIREYLRKMINDKKKIEEWKIQLVLKINFISSKNFNDVRDMHTKSDNVEIMMAFDTNEIIEKRFDSILQRLHKG